MFHIFTEARRMISVNHVFRSGVTLLSVLKSLEEFGRVWKSLEGVWKFGSLEEFGRVW